jgi:DNA invertase Pin-like site-specific DNA recombinase
MKRAVVYARYSSDLQSPESIRDQIRLCEAFAERQGWVVEARFHDAATSGVGVDHRPGYRALMAAALETPRPFDVVLVEDLSRLTRELSESDLLYRRLRLRGIDLVGVSDGLDTSRRGAAAHIAMKGAMNAIYLEDLADKTHRGLTGSVERGLSAGGTLFGYRTVAVPGELRTGGRKAPTRFEIHSIEAEVVRRIFRDYLAGLSMMAIAHALNREAVPFPAKDTKRGPARVGWAVSTIHAILSNIKYAGTWIWNQTRFLKDPETGRRRPVARPESEWVRQERADLRIVEPETFHAVQARRAQFEAGPGRPPRNGAVPGYGSPYLLSGLLRCKLCGARMTAQTAKRRKGAKVYAYRWLVCSFAKNKGPAVCSHRVWYRQERLEAALIGKFREATTPAMITVLATLVNDQVAERLRQRDSRAGDLKVELLQLEREAGHLVRFLASGGDSATVAAQLRLTEAAIAALRGEVNRAERSAPAVPVVHRSWVAQRVEHLEALLASDPRRARLEIAKHLDGDLTVEPRPAEVGERRVIIAGRVKPDALLAGGQEGAVFTEVGCGGWI